MSQRLRLTLTTADGELLDFVEITRAEFASAQRSGVAALALLDSLQPGDEGDDA